MSPCQQGKHDGFDDVELECENTAVEDYGQDEGTQQQLQKRRGSIPPDPADFYETVSVAEGEEEYDFVDDPSIPEDPHYDPIAYIPPPPWERRYQTTRLLVRDLPTHINDLPAHVTSLRQTVADLDAQRAADLAVRAARTGVAVSAVLIAGGMQVGAALLERTRPIVQGGVGAIRARLVDARAVSARKQERPGARTDVVQTRRRVDSRALDEAHEGAARRQLSSPKSSPYAMISERVDELPKSSPRAHSGAGDGRVRWTGAVEAGEQSRFLNEEAEEDEEWERQRIADELDEEEEMEYDRVVRTRGKQWIER